MPQILWTPTPESKKNSAMQKFMDFCAQKYSRQFANYFELHQWSIDHSADFWASCAQFCELKFSTPAKSIVTAGKNMRETKWFSGATLNFAQNLLSRRDDHLALIYVDENDSQRELSYKELYQRVAYWAKQLKKLGLKPGDRVAAMMTNCPETVIAMLATASVGAVWSSCSPDFGENAIIDRFSQIEPKVLFAITEYQYKGKTFPQAEKIDRLEKNLPSLIKTIRVNPKKIDESLALTEIDFAQLPFDHPLYILYTSGTTGKPKCMVHGAGNVLIQHAKELILHTDLNANDRILFNTTCGWMMWNWLISSLFTGTTVVLYEGSPFHPTHSHLIDLIGKLNISIFGIGAKYFEALEKEHFKAPNLSSLKMILTTGSPLLPTSFDFIYNNIKSDIRVSSISGGSDIVSCFALGNPILPVYRGELQCIGLGMDIKIFNEKGKSVEQEKGELVCVAPTPSMPIYFWNDANGEQYQKAYFEKFPGIWAHGDYAEITANKGLIIYGRSDATLNPGGVRVGTAEIYNQVGKITAVQDAVAVGLQKNGDEKIILFVVLKPGIQLDEELQAKIKKQIRDNTSPFHVPAQIIQAPDLPRTISGKISEISVKKLINGEKIKNTEALANPECLEFFKNLNL